MVWYQYVWEANTGNEADLSDDDDKLQEEPLHVDDWIDFNSDELEYLWAILQETMYDSGSSLLSNMKYEDLARFCFDPPMYNEGVFEVEFWIDTNMEELWYMWKLLNRTRSMMIRHASFKMFTHYCFRFR